MTSPGPVERVPLKVVPLYVQPADDEPQPTDDEVIVEQPEPSKRRALLGITAAALALATGGTHAAAIVVASARDFPTATLLGYASIGLAVLAVIAGVTAAITARGRWWGVGAAVVALLANPPILLAILRLLSGVQTR